ncbi:MAG TPA: ABC transporter substrate-binding protein [Dehalococcoidia bacterium]|nr:ABC transporter substrate-binding protein [Dehalococcoidia bacterium]
MSADYWSRVLEQRLTRRRGILGAGALGAAAALMAACGGSEDDAKSSGGKSGLLSKPADTSKQAKRGGTSKWLFTAENATLDIHVAGAPLNTPRCMVYSDLILAKPGYLEQPAFTEYLPELAESWEVSPDKLQITFKLHAGVKWHNKAPVNGRALDADDLMTTWNRFAKQGRIRTTLANSASPAAPILSWSVPDARTVVMKVKEPTVDLFAALSGPYAGLPSIIPKETDSTFDIRRDMIGTGPWVMSNYTPSSGMTFKRNPDYYEKDRLFIDQIEAPFVTEYAQQLAQFRAGNIYDLGTSIRAEDVLATKRDTPALKMYSAQLGGVAPGQVVVFGWQPSEHNKPFKDERVRQALSMSYDREAYIDVFYNVSKFKAEGLPVETRWNSSIGPGIGQWILDPRSKDFGPNSKYYQLDVAEAKKLMAAAGYANGVDVKSNYISGPELGSNWQKQISVTEEMARAVGFRPTANLIDYQKEYGPVIRDGHGKFDGWGYTSSAPPGDDAVSYYDWRFRSTGQVFLGMDPNGKGDGSGDPFVDSQILKARAEFDTEKRKAVIWELQRYLAKSQYMVPNPGLADTFVLSWPVLNNYRVWIRDRRGDNYNWWIDDTQAPLKKA